MAKDKNTPDNQSPVDNATLVENMKGLEFEKEMLLKQKSDLEKERDQIAAKREQDQQKHAQQVEELNAQIQQLQSDLEAKNSELEQKIQENSQKINETAVSDEQITQLTQERDNALKEAQDNANNCTKLQNKVNTLTEQLNALSKEAKGLILQPFVTKYLERLAEKLTAKYKKEVTPTQIIEDYIIRYNLTEHWTQWFHPWVMTEKDAVEIAHELNPEIKSYNDLKKAFNIK